jgi:hypothetical protein
MSRRRQRVDHFARPSVVQLLASLMLNRIRITLKPLNMPLQKVILPLKASQLQLQALGVLSLLLIHRQTVLAEDHVVAHRNDKNRSCSRRNLAPAYPGPLKPTRRH